MPVLHTTADWSLVHNPVSGCLLMTLRNIPLIS